MSGFAGVVTALSRELEREGIRVDAAQVADMERALTLVDPLRAAEVHHAFAPICCRGAGDPPRFTRAFRRTFGAQFTVDSTNEEELPQPGDEGVPGPAEPDDASSTADVVERLRHREVADVDLDELMAWFDALQPARPRRRWRRHARTHRGPIDLKGTLESWASADADRLRFAHHQPRRVHRPLVLVIDVSGSMRRWAPAYLLLAQALIASRPGVRVVTVATRATEVTADFAHTDPVTTQRAVGEAIPDWSSGTRLGMLLDDVVDIARGARVVVFSDGWERGDVAPLAEVAERLARRAHDLHWVAPTAGRADYRPATAGMRAVLPHLTALHAGTTPIDLRDLLTMLGNAHEARR